MGWSCIICRLDSETRYVSRVRQTEPGQRLRSLTPSGVPVPHICCNVYIIYYVVYITHSCNNLFDYQMYEIMVKINFAMSIKAYMYSCMSSYVSSIT